MMASQDLDKMAEILLADSTATSFQFSPLDSNKIWVLFKNKDNEIWEVNLIENNQTQLNQRIRSIFYYENAYSSDFNKIYHDPFEEVVWIINRSTGEVGKYDKQTNSYEKMKISRVSEIIPKAERVYFIGYSGFSAWDRKLQKIAPVDGAPQNIVYNKITQYKNAVILNDAYTYDFISGETKKGVFLDDIHLIGTQHSFLIHQNSAVLKTNNKLYIRTEDKLKALPSSFNNIERIFICPGYLLQYSDNSIIYYDIKTENCFEFDARFPDVNSISLRMIYDDENIWAVGLNYLCFISLKPCIFQYYPIKIKEMFTGFMTDKSNVYLLYKDKILIKNKTRFISSCPVLDMNNYQNELDSFRNFVNEIGIYTDSIESSATKKLQIIQQKYNNSFHIGIQSEIAELENNCLPGLQYNYPEGLEYCFRNQKFSLFCRKNCLKAIIGESVGNSKFKEAVKYNEECIKLFGQTETEVITDQQDIEKLKRYIHLADSLSMAKSSPDTLAFFKALAMKSVCATQWFADKCYDFTLLYIELDKFMQKYPHSLLADNATFEYWSTFYCGEGGFSDEEIDLINNKYSNILDSYPGTDLRQEIEFHILSNQLSKENKNVPQLKKSGVEFLKKYPGSQWSKIVKDLLSQL